MCLFFPVLSIFLDQQVYEGSRRAHAGDMEAVGVF